MKKIETIWHEILFQALENHQFKHTQKTLAEKFGYSLSTVHHSTQAPSGLGALRKTSKFFVLQDFDKLLYYWASVRQLNKDIIYQTHFQAPVQTIEGFLPPSSIFAAYTAAKKILAEPPADYSKIYLYLPIKNLPQFKKRFPPSKHPFPNLFVLKMPEVMPNYGPITTLSQTFVDLWNLADWYAKDFTQALQNKIHGLLS